MSRSRGTLLMVGALLLLALGVFSPVTTAGQKDGPPSRSPYLLARSAIGAAGAPGTFVDAEGHHRNHNGTLGQSTPIGLGSGGGYELSAGFWYGHLVLTDVPSAAPRTTLHQNYPNPFNPMTTIHYALAEPGMVDVAVYDLHGRLVRVLVVEEQVPGHHEVAWDGEDGKGRQVATGVYFCRLRSGDDIVVKKMLLVK